MAYRWAKYRMPLSTIMAARYCEVLDDPFAAAQFEPYRGAWITIAAPATGTCATGTVSDLPVVMCRRVSV